jgi:hypothetical protein
MKLPSVHVFSRTVGFRGRSGASTGRLPTVLQLREHNKCGTIAGAEGALPAGRHNRFPRIEQIEHDYLMAAELCWIRERVRRGREERVTVAVSGSMWRYRLLSLFHRSRHFQAQFHYRLAALIPFHLLKQIPGYFHQDPSPPKTELRETSTSKPAEFKWHSYRTRNTILRRPQACPAAAPQQQHPQLLMTTASPNLLPSLPRQRPRPREHLCGRHAHCVRPARPSPRSWRGRARGGDATSSHTDGGALARDQG